MNIVFLFLIAFLNLFRTYSGEEIKLSFSPNEFYICETEKNLSLKKFLTVFSSNNFGRCLSKKLYDKIEYAAIQRTYPKQKKSNKVSELHKKKQILESNFPLLLLYAESNQNSGNPFIEKSGLLNTVDRQLSSLPIVKKVVDISENLAENYHSSIGTNFKSMAQEFTIHNLFFKLTLGGSIISSIVLVSKDIISVEKLQKSTGKVILFLILANFFIFHWRKFYYGAEYIRWGIKEKEYTKKFVDFLEVHKRKIFLAVLFLEISFLLIFLYKKKDYISDLLLRYKNKNLYLLIKELLKKENLLLLNERKLNSGIVVAMLSCIFFQNKLLNFILFVSKKIEEYVISGFMISDNKKEIYRKVDNILTYVESVLYEENPQLAESEFDSLALKIKKNIENKRKILKRSERTDFMEIEEINQIQNNFTFSVVNDVTSDEIKVYDFKKRIDDFILVQKLLLLCKICLHESLFNTIELRKKDGRAIENNDFLKKIDELCEKLAKEDAQKETRTVISQTIISLFNIIKKNKEKINENQDNFWYVEELVDTDFKKQYPQCDDHINNGRKTFFNQCREVFNIKKLRDGLEEDINTFWLWISPLPDFSFDVENN
jgi:hypothetical protein